VVKWWLQFLDFREPNPTHKVVESENLLIGIAVSLPACVCAGTWFALKSVESLGLVGPLIVYAATMFIEFELLHIIYDRPTKRET